MENCPFDRSILPIGPELPRLRRFKTNCRRTDGVTVPWTVPRRMLACETTPVLGTGKGRVTKRAIVHIGHKRGRSAAMA